MRRSSRSTNVFYSEVRFGFEKGSVPKHRIVGRIDTIPRKYKNIRKIKERIQKITFFTFLFLYNRITIM